MVDFNKVLKGDNLINNEKEINNMNNMDTNEEKGLFEELGIETIEFKNVSEGMYIAELVGVDQFQAKGWETDEMVTRLKWVFKLTDVESDWQYFYYSGTKNTGKSKLRAVLKALTGEDNPRGIKRSELLGRKVKVILEERETKNGTFLNITKVMKV